MSIDIRHKALKKSSRRWLINACNPWNMGDSAVEDVPAAEVRDLLFAAELHGVLPIVHKRFRQLFAQHSTSSNPAASALADAIRNARQILVGQAAFELMLRHQAERVMAEFRQIGLDAAVIKGPTFARRLYAEPSLRSFSDIDILIPVGSRAVVGGIMSKLGFKAVERDYRGSTDYFEDVWVLESDRRIQVEIHANLAHNPKLRRFASVTYEDVLAAGGGDPEDATALLFVAASHGALSHQFDRLQHVVDVTLAAAGAAGPIDAQRLRAVAERSGVLRAIVSALVLANRTFGCTECANLVQALRPGLMDKLASRLIDPETVVAARSTSRSARSWRRKVFRQSLRMGSKPIAQSRM